jgi:hypothetical protein
MTTPCAPNRFTILLEEPLIAFGSQGLFFLVLDFFSIWSAEALDVWVSSVGARSHFSIDG